MKKLSVLVLFHSALSFVLAQETHLPRLSRTIDSIMISEKRAANIPGMVVGVIVNNRIIFKKAYGVQDIKSNTPLTNQSDFHMASVSKPFAATAIMQLVASGKLNLDGRLSDYLPSFKMKDDLYKNITLFNILTHSSGIPDVTDYEWNKPQSDAGAAERYTRSFAEKKLDFAPGTQFSYSNAAFDILADLIAKVSGKSFESYIRENIFSQAKMNSSSFFLSDIPANRRALPHTINDSLREIVSPVYPYNRIHAPSSTLHSNLDDMLKWALVWLNKGSADGQTIIDTLTWKNMLTPRRQAWPDYKVCLSWFEANIGDNRIFFHSGGDLGFRTFVGFDPEIGTAVVLMGNNNIFNAIDPGLAIFRSILLKKPAQYSMEPIFWALRNYLLKYGIKKVKAVYYDDLKKYPDKYAYGPNNLLTLADWLSDRGQKQKSVDILVFCTELEPQNPRWFEYLGDVYAGWNKKAQAVEWYKKALVLDPKNK